MSSAKPTRQLNLDALRILASFMVVLMHVSPQDWTNLNDTTIVYNTIDSIARSAVPLFFMISGALFLSKKGGISVKKLYSSNILKLLTIYLVWTVFYAVVSAIDSQAFAQQNWSEAGSLLLGHVLSPKYHLWFLPMMIVLYMAMPALYAIVHYDKARYLPYCCALFLALTVVGNSTGLIPNPSSDIPFVFAKAVVRLLGYSGYFLLGYYLSTLKLSRVRIWQLVLALVLTMGISVVLAHLYAADTGGSPVRPLLANFSLPILIEAALIFMIFVKLKPRFNERTSERTSKAIVAVSAASLAIYLIHPFIKEHTFYLFGGYEALPLAPWIAVPLVAVALFAVSMLVGLVLKKIPFVNKWIV